MNQRKWPIPKRAVRADALHLFERYHGYGGMGQAGAIWVCFEPAGIAAAAFAWQPPPFGAAKSVSPACPAGVLSLSRMVAVPRSDRAWHLSKPLGWLMRKGIDRTRWPTLVTYSDAGEGHKGHVYKCSGWVKDGERVSKRYENAQGQRRSCRTNGGQKAKGLTYVGESLITRWVHRITDDPADHMAAAGWVRVPTGKLWRSGNPAMRWERRPWAN